ncbi:unnamed protein product, partial [Didymodactylos carnosus]
MSRLDLLIFGATGYTGKYVVEELARKSQLQQNIKWGIAGRSISKLKQVLDEITKITGINLNSIETIAADINNVESLTKMCQKTDVLINCVGPYRLYGYPVIQACLNAKANYVDISGEPQFLETVQLRYNDEAEKQGVAIVGSCGFDSIIADMGVETIHISYIESFLSLKFGRTGYAVNFGTWESAVHGLSHAHELKPLRKELFPQKVPYSKYKKERSTIFSTTFDGIKDKVWCLPFPGSDKSVVHRTQYFNHTKRNKNPIRYQPYFELSSFFSLIKLIIVSILFKILTSCQFGIQLLLKFPNLFSFGVITHEGPTREQCEEASFKTRFVTYGWKQSLNEVHTTKPDIESVHEFTGPDPGYIGTSKMVLACALTLHEEKDQLPLK